MAFTNSPELQSYTTKRVPLVNPLKIRLNNNNFVTAANQGQDEGMINGLPRKHGEQELVSNTRPAINGIFLNNSGEVGEVRGMYVWEKTTGVTYSFVVVGTKVYSAVNIEDPTNFHGANWTNVNTLAATLDNLGPVRFTEFITDTGTKSLVMSTGYELWVFTTNAAGTKVVDADLPIPHVPFPVFLNGRIYLAKAGTGDIYNSDLNDPSSWTPGDFISTEVYPDDIQALVKINNYILAIGLQGSEYFYDAANTASSPLARYEGAILPFGTSIPNSIAYTKDKAVFLANTGDGQFHLIAIEGLNHTVIPTDGLISAYFQRTATLFPLVSTYFTAQYFRAYFFRHDGEMFYSILFDGVIDASGTGFGATFNAPEKNSCYTYSFSAKAWTELQYGASANRSSRYALSIKFTAPSTTGQFNTFVAGNIGANNMAFVGYLRPNSDKDVIESLTDQSIYQEWRTSNQDFDSLNRKFLYRAAISVETGPSTLNPAFFLSYNDKDYDYNSWSTAVQFNASAEEHYPFITQLGNFRRRAFRVYTIGNVVTAANYLELDMNRGIV